jgi:uncharacterized membrane protein YfcA
MDWIVVGVAIPSVVVAYIIFGIAGFGTALVSAPVLAQVMPVAKVVPLLALLDFIAAATSGLRMTKNVVVDELRWLVPMMIVGSLVGVWTLLFMPTRVMMVALGLFVVAYGVRGLVGDSASGELSRGWVTLFGIGGGMCSAMFGSGGFVYAMYLSRRLGNLESIKATQSTLIALSTLTRVIMFAIAGVYGGLDLLLLAGIMLPGMALGLYIGHRIILRMTKTHFLRILHILLIASGVVLLWRAATS